MESMNDEKREEKIKEIHKLIKEMYPEAHSVDIHITKNFIEVKPLYRGSLRGFSVEKLKDF